MSGEWKKGRREGSKEQQTEKGQSRSLSSTEYPEEENSKEKSRGQRRAFRGRASPAPAGKTTTPLQVAGLLWAALAVPGAFGATPEDLFAKFSTTALILIIALDLAGKTEVFQLKITGPFETAQLDFYFPSNSELIGAQSLSEYFLGTHTIGPLIKDQSVLFISRAIQGEALRCGDLKEYARGLIGAGGQSILEAIAARDGTSQCFLGWTFFRGGQTESTPVDCIGRRITAR